MRDGTMTHLSEAQIASAIAATKRRSDALRQLFRMDGEIVSTGDVCNKLGITSDQLRRMRKRGLSTLAEFQQNRKVKG